jgi:hypothetical protein
VLVGWTRLAELLRADNEKRYHYTFRHKLKLYAAMLYSSSKRLTYCAKYDLMLFVNRLIQSIQASIQAFFYGWFFAPAMARIERTKR